MLSLGPLVSCSDARGVHGTPGTTGLRDPYFPRLGNGGYDVLHYDLRISYTRDSERSSGQHLRGTATLLARADQDLTAFRLDLHGLDIEKVTVDGEPTRVSRNADDVTIRPRRDLRKGHEFRTVVRYSGTPRTITDPDGSEEGWLPTADGALALGQPTGSMAWFPGNHHPGDKATYDLTVTVPKGLRALSNGEPRGERRGEDGRTTYRWHMGQPMASYLTTLAIGEYEVRDTTIDVPTQTEGRSGPAPRSRLAPGSGPVPAPGSGGKLRSITAFDPELDHAAARKALDRLPEVLTWEADAFGPYPFSSAGAIVEREGDAGYALETQTRPVLPGVPGVGLLVHELAHQWFGDSVTPKSWRDMWLNEGFATYAEWLWQERHGGASAQHTFDALYAEDYFEGDPGASAAVWEFPPAEPPSARDISKAPVYQRGAMVLHKVRQRVGDKAFFALLRDWATDHRHGNADTADFTAYAEHTTGKDLGGVWKDWLYGNGKPSRP